MGTACVNQWGGKGPGRSEKQKRECREFRVQRLLQSPGRTMDCPLGNCALTSHALDQLLQLMDILVRFLASQKLLPNLMKSRDRVAAQKAIHPTAATVHAGHRSPQLLRGHKSQLALSSTCSPGHALAKASVMQRRLGEPWLPETQICDSAVGKSLYASPPSTPSKGARERSV